MKEEIIIAVQSRPALWDKRNKHHMNRHILAREWTDIAKELKTSEKTVRQIWKNLRQEFGKQLRKNSQSDAAAPETPTWKYYDSLLFLNEQFTHRKSKSDISKTEDVTSCEEEDLEESTEIFGEEVDNDNPIINMQLETDSLPTPQDIAPYLLQHLSSTTYPSTNNANTSDQPTRAGLKRRITTQAEIGQQLMQLQRDKQRLKRRKREEMRNDEDVGFFNSILPHVRTLDPRKKMLFRMKVQEVLFEMAYSEAQPPYSAPSTTIDKSSHRYSPSLGPYDTSSSSSMPPSPTYLPNVGNDNI